MLEVSPLRLNMFRQCRRQYRYRYVDGLARQYGKPRPYFTMGGHVHAALSAFLSPTTPLEKRTYEHLESLLRHNWGRNRKGFANREEERYWGEKALRQLRGFCESQNLLAAPWMIEAIHKAPLTANLRLMGKVDRVDKTDDGLVVVDYKTGKRPLIPNLLQLRTYVIILQKKYNLPVTAARYLYLESGGVTEVRPGERDLMEAEEELIAGGEEIMAEREFPPAPNRLCPYCDFLEICPEGIAYGGSQGSADEGDPEE